MRRILFAAATHAGYNSDMAIELTREQQDLIDAAGKPAEVIDPRGHRRYVLLPADEYEKLCDDREQAALRQDSMAMQLWFASYLCAL